MNAIGRGLTANRLFILHVILKEPFIIISTHIECDVANTQLPANGSVDFRVNFEHESYTAPPSP